MGQAKTQLSKRFLGNGSYVALTTDTGDRTRFCDRVLPEGGEKRSREKILFGRATQFYHYLERGS